MDNKTQFIIKDIIKYGVTIDSDIFYSLYYTKFFSSFKFENKDVKDEDLNQYNNILKNLFNTMIEDSKRNRNISIWLGIAIYFLGSFVRDYLIELAVARPGDLTYIGAYFLWIVGFAWSFIKSYSNHVVSKGIQKYIQNDIKDNSTSFNSNKSIIDNSIETKLIKIKEMYEKKIISEEEYESLRRKALEKL
jgi:predicted oxidoreductase (fatty acid repression mutant protein)